MSVRVTGAVKKRKRETNEPEPVPSFTEAHAAFETVKSFFYTHSIGEHDEQVILNLELAVSSEM
jgi:hypothetical protein